MENNRDLSAGSLFVTEPTFVHADFKAGKRALDLIVSIVLMILLMPLLILIATSIKVSEGGPVFFTQVRIGKNGSRFRCVKFKTMVADAEQVLDAYLEQCSEARIEWME